MYLFLNLARFIFLALSNQRGELGTGDESGGETGFNLDQYVDGADTQETESDTPLENDGSADQDENQSDESGDAGDSEESISDRFDKLSDSETTEKPKEGEEVLKSDIDMINGLGLLRNGLPIKYETIDQVKEILQKDYDQTQKYQEIADFRKQSEQEISTNKQTFEAEVKTFGEEKQKFTETINDHDVVLSALEELKQTNPDIFDEFLAGPISRHTQMQKAAHNNPYVSSMQKELQELKGEFGKLTEAKELEKSTSINDKFSEEFKSVQSSYATKLKSLKIVPNWKSVEDYYRKHNGPEMTVKQALMAVHGEDMEKSFESLNKNLSTKNKSNLRMGPGNKSGNSQKKYQGGSKNGSFMSVLEKYAADELAS